MKNTSSSRPPSFWGKGLAIAIVLFISTTLGVVAFLVSLDFQMVTENHYQEAVQYQQQIDRIEHARAMEQPVTIKVLRRSRALEIQFPPAMAGQLTGGSVTLYRPSDADLDRRYTLDPANSSGLFHIAGDSLAPGKWQVKINWQAGGQRYYRDQSIFLN